MKRILCLLLSLFFLLALPLSSFASTKRECVIDEADLLTDGEEKSLREKIKPLIDEYSYDIVILTVDDIGAKSPKAYSDDYYDNNGYGIGENRDGMLFMLSMADRDYWTSTRGSGEEICGDYFIEIIDDSNVVSLLSDGEYYEAFSKYLDIVSDFLTEADENEPYSDTNRYRIPMSAGEIAVLCAVVAVISIIVAFIYVSALKSKMRTAVAQRYAASYIRPDSFKLNRANDLFLYSRTTRTPRPKDTSSSGGGSHTSSSGASHGGGGGKF